LFKKKHILQNIFMEACIPYVRCSCILHWIDQGLLAGGW
jgi:hypothetical protein